MKKNTHRNIIILLAFVLLLILGACTAPSEGIFYSISLETRIDKKANGIPTDVSTSRFTIFVGDQSLNTVQFSSFLVISGARLFIAGRNASGEISGSWQKAVTPDGRETCVDVAVTTSAIYAIFSSDTRTNGQLFRAVFTGAENAGTLDWQLVSGIADAENNGVDRVFSLSTATAIGDKVLAQVTTNLSVLSPSHTVWLIDGSSAPTSIRFNGVYHEGTSPTEHATLDGSYALNSVSVDGSNIWAVSNFDLYHIGTGSAARELGATSPLFVRVTSAGAIGRGVFRATGVDAAAHRLYIVTSDGYVHRTSSDASPSATVWASSDQKSDYNLKSISPINLADQKDAPRQVDLARTLVAGTSNSKGIVTIKDDGDRPEIVGNTGDNVLLYNSNYSSSNVASKSVNDVVWSGNSNHPFFITTSKLGLWSIKYKSSYAKDGVTKQGLEFTWE